MYLKFYIDKNGKHNYFSNHISFEENYLKMLPKISHVFGVTVKTIKCLVTKVFSYFTRIYVLQECYTLNVTETICYEELGCYHKKEPWHSLTRPFPLPQLPQHINTTFILYTRNEPKGHNIILWPKIDQKDADYNHSREATVFLTHGFYSSGEAEWIIQMKDAYLKNIDANLFVVDWKRGSKTFNYLQAASNIRVVGAELVRFGEYLIQNGLTPDKLHLIGHSLGAHAMAYMAKGLNNTSNRVGRLTALDPAQPGFENAPEEVRVAKNDAVFTDIIHTDAKPFIPFGGMGMMKPIGDVDFYMNGGSSQPGCLTPKFPNISSITDFVHKIGKGIKKIYSCSHHRSYEYFIWALTLKNCSMWGRKAIKRTSFFHMHSFYYAFRPLSKSLKECDENSCSVIGLKTFKLKARGTFYVKTKSSKPFCDTGKTLSRKLDTLIH